MPLDYVLGPGAYQWRGDCLVRLDEVYRKCIVLIGTAPVGITDEIEPWGTGFIVCDSDCRITYLITAAHVIADKRDCPFDVRFNRKDGGAENHLIEDPCWVLHPTDNTIDVAVHEIEVPQWAETTLIPRHPNLLREDRIESKNIGAGSRTYTVGLWKFLHGDLRNQPFVYTGHIGLVPEDQRIPVKPWLKEQSHCVFVEAYLVEGEPLDGASGSPVFVRRSIPQMVDSGEKRPVAAMVDGPIWLLGIQSDAFFGEPGEDYEIPTAGKKIVPRGVNVVVPALKIIEVLDHPDLIARREELARERNLANSPMKTKSELSTEVENPRHKEDFNRLLGAAVQKPEQDDQT